MDQLFKSMLLQTPFANVLQQLAEVARSHTIKPKRTAISYAWPTRADEQDLQARVLRMRDDLVLAGVHASLDLTCADANAQHASCMCACTSTIFPASCLEWITQSELVLLVGSVSYAERAKDPATPTYVEAHAMAQKKAKSSDSVIPLLMVGEFWNAFPPGYSGTMGASMVDPTQYFQNFPEIVAKCLDIRKMPEVINLLKNYRRETDNILREKVDIEHKEQLQAQVELQRKFWKSRVLILRSKFNIDLLHLFDGSLKVLDKKINEFCERETQLIKVDTIAEDTSVENSATSLESRLTLFLRGTEQVLLLHASPGSGKSHACQYLSKKAWRDYKWVPVFIHLDKIKLVNERCVDQALASHGLDDVTIAHAKATRYFLIVVEGFDRCNVMTNLYVRCKLDQWRGKVVFPIRSSYVATVTHAPFYFMPAGLHNRPKPQGLCIIGFNSKFGGVLDSKAPAIRVQVPEIALQVAKSNDEAQKSKRARDRWYKAVGEVIARRHLKSYVLRYAKDSRKRFNEGYLLLQRDILRPVFLQFLDSLSRFDPNHQQRSSLPGFISFQSPSSPVFQKLLFQDPADNKKPKAFISYAWPIDNSDLTWLQGRLLEIVEDLQVAGIEVLLDILRLSVGVDINQFMEEGIETSDTILWILTPRLKERINFSISPPNPATIECLHIQEKVKTKAKALHPLWFVGEKVEDTYPTGGVLSLKNMKDFRDEKEYFRHLPLLAAHVLDIAHLPSFRDHYKNYFLQTKSLEENIIPAAVWRRLEEAENELKESKVQLKERLQELTATIPKHFKEYLLGAQEIQRKAIHSLLLHFRDNVISPATSHAQALSFYVPLKGGTQIDTPSTLCFDSASRVHTFLNQSNVKVLLIQGGAGSGKSLFGRYMERDFWRKWDSDDDVIPLFISLSQTGDPYNNIIQTTLQSHHFSDEHITLLKERRFIFILDGLDELPVENLPTQGILVSNNLFVEWPNSKIVITCRSQHLPSIDQYFNATYSNHLLQGQSTMEEFHLMPFDDSQIAAYLKQHASTPDAEWPDWNMYHKRINLINGLKALATTPFILKLLVRALPRLTVMHSKSANLNHPVWQHDLEIKILQEDEKALQEQLKQREEKRARRTEQMLRSKKLPDQLDEEEEDDEVAEIIEQEDIELDEDDDDAEESLSPAERQRIRRKRELLRMSSRDLGMSFDYKKEVLVKLLEPVGHKKVLRVDVYEAFVDQWFEQEMWKELTQHDVPLSEDRKANYRDLSMNLSKVLFSSGATQISLSQVPGNYPPHLVRGLPIQQNGGGNISFVHKSIQEYFVACEWIKAIDSGDQVLLSQVMNTRLITNEISFLNFIGQLFREVPHKETLLQQIYSSRSDSSLSIAAANAITILNTAQCSLSSLDLSKVNIQGANLDHALMDRVNLREANLSDVSMRQAWLYCGDLSGANMDGVQFGQLPWFDCGKHIYSMALDEKEEILALGITGKIEVWDILSNVCVKEFSVEVAEVLIWEGKVLSGSKKGVIQIWNISTGLEEGAFMKGNKEEIIGLAISNTKTLLAASSSGIQEWDLVSKTQIGRTFKTSLGDITCMTSYEDKVVAGVAGDGGMIVLWNYDRKQVGEPLYAHRHPVSAINVHKGKIVSGGYDGTIKIWDAQTMLQLGDTITRKGKSALSIALTDDKIVTGSIKGTIAIWDLSTGQFIEEFRAHHDRIVSVKAWKDKVISGSWDGTARVWELVQHQRVRKLLEGHGGEVKSVFVHDGKVISSGPDGVRVWDTVTGHQDLLTGREGGLDVKDGKITYASASFVQVWDIATRKELLLHRAWNNSYALCMTEHKGKLITGDYYGYIAVADLEKGEVIREFIAHDNMYVTAVVVVDELIVSGGHDGAVFAWDLATGSYIHQLKGEDEDVVKCLVPYRDMVIAGCDDGILRMWRVKNNEKVTEIKAHNGVIWCLAVMGEGERKILLSGGADTTIKLWDLEKKNLCLLEIQLDAQVRSLACQGEDVAVACGDRVQFWKISAKVVDENEKESEKKEVVRMHFCGSRPDQWPLYMAGCRVEGVTGLSKTHEKLVTQLQSCGTPLIY